MSLWSQWLIIDELLNLHRTVAFVERLQFITCLMVGKDVCFITREFKKKKGEPRNFFFLLLWMEFGNISLKCLWMKSSSKYFLIWTVYYRFALKRFTSAEKWQERFLSDHSCSHSACLLFKPTSIPLSKILSLHICLLFNLHETVLAFVEKNKYTFWNLSFNKLHPEILELQPCNVCHFWNA